MGYRHRRPRYDLRHRQDAAAVAHAGHALARLQKGGFCRPRLDAAGALLDRTEARLHADEPPGFRLVNDFCEAA